MKVMNIFKGLILIMIGGAIQNILWYIRLQNPILLREFKMYWEMDGARLFLYFNAINYFFIFISIIIFIIFTLIDKRKKKLNEVKRDK